MDDGLNTRHIKYLRMLEKIAEDVIPVGSSKMAAAVVLNGSIISFGINQKKSHPFQAKYSKNIPSIFFHAETHAICNALKKIDTDSLKKARLYITRIKYDSPVIHKRKRIWGLSYPCIGCQFCINTFGIKEVIYTLEGIDNYEIQRYYK